MRRMADDDNDDDDKYFYPVNNIVINIYQYVYI